MTERVTLDDVYACAVLWYDLRSGELTDLHAYWNISARVTRYGLWNGFTTSHGKIFMSGPEGWRE